MAGVNCDRMEAGMKRITNYNIRAMVQVTIILFMMVCLMWILLNRDNYLENNTENTGNVQTTSSDKNIVTCSYRNWTLESGDKILKQKETGKVVGINDADLDVQVLEAATADSIYQLEKFSGYNESEFFDKLARVELVNEKQQDGTFKSSVQGIDDGCIFIRMKITNKSDKEIKVPMDMFRIGSMSENNNYCQSIANEVDVLFDKLVYTDNDFGCYNFAPYEELETVLVYVYQTKKLISYELYKDSDGKDFMENIYTRDIDYDNLYLRTNLGGNKNVKGECYIKLEIN